MKTIVALCTAPLNSAIHIIRLSGDNSFNIAQKILKNKLKKQKNYFGLNYVIDSQQEIVDQVLVLEFISPYSFTGEDVVEISCHGGIFVANKIIELLLKNGAELAKNGEFSMRSTLNNKMTLVQAEATNILINSANEMQLKIASKALDKSVSINIEKLSEEVMNIISRIELDIDYPEYEMEEKIRVNELFKFISEIDKKINTILYNSKKISKISNGISLCIVGKPNAGKSSLLNALANEERAIVSEEEGTTRDTVTINISINNLPLKIIDTAGIRKTNNKIESLGINKAEEAIEKSDIVLHLIDANKGWTIEDDDIMRKYPNKENITVFNKSDLIEKQEKHIYISALNRNIDPLIKKLEEKFLSFNFDKMSDNFLINNRHIQILESISSIIKNILETMDLYPVDIISSDLYLVYEKLKDILGRNATDDFGKEIFKNFCIGK